MTNIISYAQNFEDVMLWRALGHVENGFYIDIGAQDPLIDSVSLAFHEHGWRGIHVEPTPHYAELLRQQRPGGTIIQTAVGNGPAVLTFFEIPDTGISTADPVIAQQHRERGFDVREITVPCIALSAIFATCCTEPEIHWLKIDVEGFEQQVLSSWGASTLRPWIVVVESTLPLTQIETNETWEGILINYGYSSVYFDGLNRYYVSDVHPELKDAFRSPPNVFDGFTLNGTASNPIHHLMVARHKQQISEIMAQNEQQKLANDHEIERLTLSLATLEKTHAEHEQNLTRREQEIAAQLLAIQQQANQEKAEQERSHSEQARELHHQHVQREQILTQQLQTGQQELCHLEQGRAQREKEHAEQTRQIQQELENLLRTQIQREQVIAEQLLAIQQQAAQAIVEQTRSHNAQAQNLQRQHTEREQTLSQQHQAHLQNIQRQQAEHEWLTAERIYTLNQELHRLQADNATREQAHADIVDTLQNELATLLRMQVQREQEMAAQLLAIQQQADAAKTELSQQHQAHLQNIQRQQAEHEWLTAERIYTLNQELHRLQADNATREQAHADIVDTLQNELATLLRMQVQREQEMAAQLLAIQQQADAAKTELSQQHQAHLQNIQRQQAEHEWLTAERIYTLNQELHRLQADNATREQAHADIVDTLQNELATLLRMQVQREQEMAAQLLAIQQQADQGKAEQAHNHSEQAHALQHEHAGREQALNHQLQTKQQELHSLEQTRADMQHQLNAQLQAEREASQQLQQVLTALQAELATLRNGLSWRLTAPLRAVAGWFKPAPAQTGLAISAAEQPVVATLSPPEPYTATPDTQELTSNRPLSETTSMTSNHTAQAPQPSPSSTTPNLNTLLQYQDHQFVEFAYLTLLKRLPDAEGLNYYLGRLRAGVPKIQILGQLLDSDEAQGSGVEPQGLRDAVQRQKLARLPLIGAVIKYFIKVEGNSAFENRLRAIEQQIFLLEKQSDTRFERIDHGLNNLQELILQQNQQLLVSIQQSIVSIVKVTESTAELIPSNSEGITSIRKTYTNSATNNSLLPLPSRVIYYFVDHTIKCPINTGMQRVVRRLGRSLSESIETFRFVKWDAALQALVLINRDELEHLSKWHGPDLTDDVLHTYPLPDDEPVLIEPQNSNGSQWLVVPEVTHVTYHTAPVTLDIITAASRMGLKTAFVYYDAIPLRLKEYKGSAEQHEMYMQHLLLADLIIPISFRSGIELTEFFKIHQGSSMNTPKIKTIPLPGESQLSPRINNPVQITADEGFILCVGSIEPRKNQVILTKAFERFCETNPDTKWRLVLAGNLRGDVAAEINDSITRNSRISHIQSISDIDLDHLYRTCAFTVFPSVEEGFGLPILESLWYAKPCICANFGAMAEVAKGGGCYMVDTHQVGELENAISRLVKHTELRQRLAKEASMRPINSWKDYSQSIIKLIDEESNVLHKLEYVFYWVDNTCVNSHNSGIQRVVRQLARALISLGIKLIPIKWDAVSKNLYSPTPLELDHLSNWNGPYPKAWTTWVDPRQVSAKSWILIPELTHGTLADVKKYALDIGIRCSAVFYDAIPWKMREIFPHPFGENHRQYMEDLSNFEKILPISNYSHSELIEFFLSTTIRTHSLDHRIQTCTLPTEFIDVPRVTNIKRHSNSVIKILTVISMEPRKNPLALLEAFAKASNKTQSKIELILVGRKIEAFAELSAKVEHQISLLENVIWEKDVDDARLQSLYAQSDFTIFPSIEEGFGLPILESLWNAIPCICHNEGAMREVAEGGGCLSIDVTDIEIFSNAIVRLTDDPELRIALASAASTRPIKSWLDYAQEVAASMATDRQISANNITHTVSDEVRMYQELVNLEQRPLLSICISTYNRAEWLSVGLRNLERMIPNPSGEVEILVCDNTSTDHTPDVVQPYLPRSDFKYIRNEKNVGMLGNLRVTAHHARGQYIWILGDDDLAMPGSIEKILSIIRSEPELALIYLNYSYTRETDASVVKDLDQFFSQATTLIESSQDMAAPVKEITANNENLFTAIYCLVFRRDHALRAYSQNTDGRPFSTMRTSIPTTYYVLNFMMEEPAYWVGTPQLVVNFNVSWNMYAALQILERVPEAQDLAERMGASPTGMDRWRQNLFPGFVHYFTEMFENDLHSNAEFFSPVRLVARMKHIDAFKALVPALRIIYESAYRADHPAAKISTRKLFAAFYPSTNEQNEEGIRKFSNATSLVSYLDSLSGADQRQAMFETILELDSTTTLSRLDPFSTEYKAECLVNYEHIAGQQYSPASGELMPTLSHFESNSPPPPFSSGTSVALGDYFMAWDGIMHVLDMKAGMSILKFGPGDGHISVALARMQCDVYVLDIEPYVESIQAQASRFGVPVNTKCGLFIDEFDGRKFDRILFFEAFHHELHHDQLLDTLRGMLNPDGFIVFSGEPIIERGNPMVPYCWGPRLDGMSVWCMYKWGWFELGFERGYFVELLMRHGFTVRRWMDPATGLGNCFIAEPNRGVLKLGEHEIDVARGNGGWYPAEGTHRWTWGHALIPIDQAHQWKRALLRGANHTPIAKPVTLRCGSLEVTVHVDSGHEFEVSIYLQSTAEHLEILVPVTVPKDFGGLDPRSLGISVRELEYSA